MKTNFSSIGKSLLLLLFYTGWLLPFFLSADCLFHWIESPGDSFPFLHHSRKFFLIAFAWMAAVTFSWSLRMVLPGKWQSPPEIRGHAFFISLGLAFLVALILTASLLLPGIWF